MNHPFPMLNQLRAQLDAVMSKPIPAPLSDVEQEVEKRLCALLLENMDKFIDHEAAMKEIRAAVMQELH